MKANTKPGKRDQRNVTLETSAELEGKPFPCPVCNILLPIKLSQKGKPYCTCNDCGVQLFVRGKTGIHRLEQHLRTEQPLEPETVINVRAVTLYNRLAKLEEQHKELESKQGMIFQNRDLDNAIIVLDGEIKRVQVEIENVRKEAEKKK